MSLTSKIATSPSEQGPIGNTGARLRLGKRTVNPEVAGSSPVEPANQAFPRWWPPIFPPLGGRSMSRIAGEYAILASRSASATGLPVSGRLRDCGSPFIRGSGLPVDGHTSPRGGGPEVAPQEAGVNVYHPRPSLRADVARRSRRAVWAHARVLARVSLSDR